MSVNKASRKTVVLSKLVTKLPEIFKEIDLKKGMFFVMHKKKQKTLKVATRATNLYNYVMTITSKPRLKNRFIYTARLQDFSQDAIKHIYRANDTFATGEACSYKKSRQRLNFQREALTEFRMLVYFAQLALEQEAMSPKQYERISKQSEDCINLVGSWILSDEKLLCSKNAHDSSQ